MPQPWDFDDPFPGDLPPDGLSDGGDPPDEDYLGLWEDFLAEPINRPALIEFIDNVRRVRGLPSVRSDHFDRRPPGGFAEALEDALDCEIDGNEMVLADAAKAQAIRLAIDSPAGSDGAAVPLPEPVDFIRQREDSDQLDWNSLRRFIPDQLTL